MALQCPIIASDADCFLEVLAAGQRGVLTPRGDAKALGTAISRLASEPSLRTQMALQGLNAFQDHYEISAVRDQMISLYRLVSRGERVLRSMRDRPGALGNPT